MSLTLSEIKNLKQEYGFSNEWVAEKSGVPLGTVQKIFSEQVKSPRRSTVYKLSDFFEQLLGYKERGAEMVHEAEVAYKAIQKNKVTYRTFDGVIMEEEGVYRRPESLFRIGDLDFLPEDKSMELIDGALYEINAPSVNHQIAVRDIFSQLLECKVRSGKDCQILFAPCCVQIDCDDISMMQPDLFVVCDDSKVQSRVIYGAPDLIIEILSKSTMKKDMTVKLKKYWESGVREYWIVDPLHLKVIVYDFQHDDLDHLYSFDDKVPLGISEGECEIDFRSIAPDLIPEDVQE